MERSARINNGTCLEPFFFQAWIIDKVSFCWDPELNRTQHKNNLKSETLNILLTKGKKNSKPMKQENDLAQSKHIAILCHR